MAAFASPQLAPFRSKPWRLGCSLSLPMAGFVPVVVLGSYPAPPRICVKSFVTWASTGEAPLASVLCLGSCAQLMKPREQSCLVQLYWQNQSINVKAGRRTLAASPCRCSLKQGVQLMVLNTSRTRQCPFYWIKKGLSAKRGSVALFVSKKLYHSPTWKGNTSWFHLVHLILSLRCTLISNG